MSSIKVLIVDDSPVVREQALNMLRGDPDIEVLGIADSKENASEKIQALNPDVITLCLKSKQNQASFIKAITSQISIPVVVITEVDVSHQDVEKAKAVSFVKVPLIRTASTMERFAQRVIQQIKEMAKVKANPVPVQTAPKSFGKPAAEPAVQPSKEHKHSFLSRAKAPEPTPQPNNEPAKHSFLPRAKAPEPVAQPIKEPVKLPFEPKVKAPEPIPKVPESAQNVPELWPKDFEPKVTPVPAAKPEPPAIVKPEPPIIAKPEPPVTAKSEPPVAAKPDPLAIAKPEPPAAEVKPIPTTKANPEQPAPKMTVPAEPKSTNKVDATSRAIAAVTAAKQVLGGQPTPRGRHHVIALGASTGGTDALHTVLCNLPTDTPGIVIVQHMPELFTKMYADRLNRACKMSCVEAVDGERVEVGKIILAAGNFHLRLAKDSRGYYVTSQRGEKVSGHCPSVDVLFESVANTAGSDAIGAIFTGMGADGAIGLKKMRDAGAFTIGQDEKTCVVYGMPMVAYNMGGVCRQAPLDQIADIILENC